MSRTTAGERVKRLLALVPWVTAHSPVSVDEVCARFGITRTSLLADLAVLPYVGVPPYTPDTMIDVEIDDDLIVIRLSEPFDRPLRLTSAQALALIAAGRSIRGVQGADADDPLQRALAKLANALNVDPDQVNVALGEFHHEVLGTIVSAIHDSERIDIDYYTFSRDERSVRRIDPYQVVADQGSWYLTGWCHRSEEVRVFRVDRIASVDRVEERIDPPPADAGWDRYTPGVDEPRVTLDLAPSARWLTEQYPHDSAIELDGGILRVTLAVTARPWLERLLVTLGPAATVVEAPEQFADAASDAATRILARYGAI